MAAQRPLDAPAAADIWRRRGRPPSPRAREKSPARARRGRALSLKDVSSL